MLLIIGTAEKLLEILRKHESTRRLSNTHIHNDGNTLWRNSLLILNLNINKKHIFIEIKLIEIKEYYIIYFDPV